MKFKQGAAMALGLAGVLMSTAAKAEDAKKPAWYEKINASGFIDAYYQYNFNGLSAPVGPSGRAFDLTQQQFAFSGAKLSLAEADAASKTSGQLDLFYGPTAKVFNSTLAAESIAVEQAFVTQAFGPVTFKLGKFTTFVGTEVIETPANMNYSRSILFGQIPYYHVGLEATYAIMDGLSAMAYTGNGNSVDTASNEYKDWGLQVSFAKIKGLGLIGNYYMESTATGPVYDNTHYFNLLGSYQINDSLSSAVEYLYKTRIASGDTDSTGALVTSDVQFDPSTGKLVKYSPKMQGYALYLNYMTPIAGLSVIPRFEQWYQPDTIPATFPADSGTMSTETTLTLKYVAGPLTHTLEYRNDWTNLGGYAASAGTSPSTIQYMQNTLTYGAVFSF
jgi:hypothetical protein